MGKRILITGGLGVVGRKLTSELRGRGHEVTGCDLCHGEDEYAFSTGTDSPSPNYVKSDVGEYRQMERVFERLGHFDFVFHCAAEFGRWNGEDYYETLWKSNVIGTKNIIRLQEKLQFKLVFFSSSEIYGDWPDLLIETTTDIHPIRQLNDYAMTKWVGEMQVRNSEVQFGTETVIVRLFNTYGPGEFYSPYRSVNCRFLYCALKGIPWTVHRGHHRTSTYLSDATKTLANIVDNFQPGSTYNIGGDHLHSIEELSDIVIRVTGASLSLVNYQEPEILTTHRKLVDSSRAVRDLGHCNSYDLETGMRLTAAWMREVYGISDTVGRRSPICAEGCIAESTTS